MAKKKKVTVYQYECTLTGHVYKTTREAPHPEELVSVEGYYQLHPEKDDRPDHVKAALNTQE